jgi:iron complex outermembrane recepter protein
MRCIQSHVTHAACHQLPAKLRRPSALAVALWALGGAAHAQPAPTQLDSVVVSGSGVERRAFETPYAVSVVDAAELRSAGPMVNLSESLNRVPGLVVNLRNNYAQDLQLSSRGFGARATFGIRGLRLYTDGIPATMPDGQGQVSHFDIAGAQRIEVLRGPFSALYGANSGGVISLVSAAPRQNAYSVDGDMGSDGLWQARLGIESLLPGGWNIRALASQFSTDGVRPHSAAQRTLGNVRLGWVGDQDTVTLLLNSVSQPAQDPLGLTRAQFDADPYQTTPQAILFDTRKTSGQTQGGATWRHRFMDAGALRESVLTAYAGQRDVTQWQAIPPATQASPRHPGGVIDFGRDYSGLDARLVWRWDSASLVAGVATERQSEDRRGFENFSGSGADQVLGVTGALRRNESNSVRSSDLYLQGEIELAPSWMLTAGLRSGRLRVETKDQFLSNGDDSGTLSYGYNTPVLALQWLPAPGLNLYVSAGQGFESPTLNELAYRPDGATGFNTTLQPQTSLQLELGAKWRDDALGLGVEAALFRADTDDEIGVLTNAGGRSTFQNVGSTRRSGAELGLRWQPHADWRALLAMTYLDAVYRDSFETCSAVPCTQPQDRVTVPAGNQIAGTMARSAFASLAWRALPSTELAFELRYQGSMPVNDRNSDFSPAATISALRLSHSVALGPGTLSVLARLDNLADKAYAGAVIVNETNGRYFETAAGRNALLALRWQAPF